jgi:hypothetical protein
VTVDPYTLTEADIAACREILAQLEEIDREVGGYYVDSVQGHMQSATVTIRYQRKAGALATARAADVGCQAVDRLGTLCKKVISHYETHGASS